MILEGTLEQVTSDLAMINALSRAYWASEGYEVINGELIGKDAATGIDEPEAQHTKTWDEIKQSPEGTYYIFSLTGDPKFIEWKDRLAAMGYALKCTERDLPEEWTGGGL